MGSLRHRLAGSLVPPSEVRGSVPQGLTGYMTFRIVPYDTV